MNIPPRLKILRIAVSELEDGAGGDVEYIWGPLQPNV